MNIVFAGTPPFAIPCLEKIYGSEHTITAVYTQPDRPAGRGRKMQASAVKMWAESHSLPIFQPTNFKDQNTINELAELAPDIMVVIAYGLILPKAVLDIPRIACINVHASILPQWRGASPIQHSILHGDKLSGVTIMQMDAGMDTGGIYTIATCAINENDTAGDLHDKISSISAKPLLETINKIEHEDLKPTPQDNNLATYAGKISKQDAAIDWSKTSVEIDQQIRAFNPWPIAHTRVGDLVVRIYKASIVLDKSSANPGTITAIDKKGITIATSKQSVCIESFQFPGGKAVSVANWLNANRGQLQVGMILQ